MTEQLPMPPYGVGLDSATKDDLTLLWELAAKTRTPCQGAQDEFVDYETPPTDEEADKLCAGCPLIDLCGRVAERSGATAGVWGGKVYDERE